jgi:hypothetical protein
MGWLLGITTFLFIPGYAIYVIFMKLKNSEFSKKNLIGPTAKWIPAVQNDEGSVIRISECQL